MKTQDEINRPATEYAEEQDSAYTNDLYGFLAGANFANGYSVEEMEKFDLWKYNKGWRCSVVQDGTYYNDKTELRLSLQDLLKLYNERK